MRAILIAMLAASAFGVLGISTSTPAAAACYCSQKAGCALKGCIGGKCNYLCKPVKAPPASPK